MAITTAAISAAIAAAGKILDVASKQYGSGAKMHGGAGSAVANVLGHTMSLISGAKSMSADDIPSGVPSSNA